MRMKAVKLGHVRDVQIKIVPEGPPLARVGGLHSILQMLLVLHFSSSPGAPGARLLWHKELSTTRVSWICSDDSQPDLSFWLYLTQTQDHLHAYSVSCMELDACLD